MPLPGVLITIDNQAPQRIRNPYHSPRVLKAVLDDVIEQMQVIFYGYLLSPNIINQMQAAMDAVTSQVVFHGVPLIELVHLRLSAHPMDSTTFIVTFHGVSEDGRWLLKQLEGGYNAVDMVVLDETKPMLNVKRIVEV